MKAFRFFRNAWPHAHSPWANVEDGKVGTGEMGVQRVFDSVVRRTTDAGGSLPLSPTGPSPADPAPPRLFSLLGLSAQKIVVSTKTVEGESKHSLQY